MKRYLCDACGKPCSSVNRHGFCGGCEQEHEQIRAKLRCVHECPTPLSCLTAGRCLYAESLDDGESAKQFELL